MKPIEHETWGIENDERGFIALISVVIIVLILLGTTAALATSGFLNRFNILEGEAKETSAGLALACVEAAKISIARDGDDYNPTNEEYAVDEGSCTVISVNHGANTLRVKGVYKQANTNYEATFNPTTFQIESLNEFSEF